MKREKTLKYEKFTIKESDYNFLSELESKSELLLKKKHRIIILVTGKPGCGKSTFGKFVRKKGFGNFSPSEISVIDDDVMSREHLFGLIRTKMKSPSSTPDNLAPFLKLLPKRKKIIFYINSFPGKRIDKADIVLVLHTDEEAREKRLLKRVGESQNFDNLLTSDYDISTIKYTYKVFGCTR
ncbi:AAA family ATPase [Nitratifractor salsuginis]|uniref:Uncharacterized protein n=1 Tax=Nitratifractor salsuginis (strain DSM 16511 / JCM 12458 / E9I37-1) TaxID=749222 RepID=E6WZD5_NITSE|nr:AAA family ATPase [Nitratifractor salsuginis]ADV46647.1 hypothetical protein Nitsa_1396 [Nitratifractor salsuginis DSM 16511]